MKRNYFVLFLAGILVIILIVLIGTRESSRVATQPTPTPVAENLKIFKSDVLDFTVQIPEDYVIEEKFTHIDFRNSDGAIGGDRTDATGLNTLEDFLAYVDDKNKLKSVSTIDELDIDGNPAMIRLELRGGVEFRIVYIYVNGWVYVFSTESKRLFTVLDQIAQSFRYTP